MSGETIVLGCILAVLGTAGMLFLYFYKREQRLLERLRNMVDEARKGSFQYGKISEESLSALENSMKRFLDESLIAKENQERQKQLIQELISDIAHQTLTPISNLKLYSELLKERIRSFQNNGETEEIADTLSEQTNKLDFLIQSLVRLSRLESGIIGVHPTRTAPGPMLERILGEYRGKAAEKKQTLFLQAGEEEACMDEKWTEEAVGNLVDNAVKYTAEGGRIAVWTEAFPTFLCIHVKDSGKGIPEAEINKIFTRFYRGKDVSELPGVGIGLYLSREIIRAQRGYIKVVSKVGEGSDFSVFLPR